MVTLLLSHQQAETIVTIATYTSSHSIPNQPKNLAPYQETFSHQNFILIYL